MFWTKEKSIETAKKCKTRTEFNRKYQGAWRACYRNGWLEDIWSHLPRLGNKYFRIIYAYIFSDKYVYVGLTGNSKIRKEYHLNNPNSPVNKHIKLTGLSPMYVELTEHLEANIASKKECEYVQEYQLSGYILLNKKLPGGLGGSIRIWTKEKCIEEALKYDYRGQFSNESPSAYVICKRNGWLNEVCSHMKKKIYNPANKIYTKDYCKSITNTFLSKNKFKKMHSSMYVTICANEWLEELCGHMKNYDYIPHNKKWTKTEVIKEANKYRSKTDLKKNNGYVYNLLYKNKWMKEAKLK